MSTEIGLSISFRWSRIRFRTALIECIGNPEYIHLLVDARNKLLYIQSCERDKDAFKVYFRACKRDAAFYIRGKSLMQNIAKLIGVDGESTLRYAGTQIDESTIVIYLNAYEEIAREQE